MLTGERRALAAAVFAFYAFLYLIVALQPPMPGWATCFGALAAVYGIGFFGLVAGYFWARWFSIGLGISGSIAACVSIWQVGLEPVILFYGGTHLGACIVLWGASMASAFDGKIEWRERFHLDESGTNKLGKAVIRAGVSLPYVIMYALAPKEDMGYALLAVGSGALAVAGVWGIVKMRSWGVLALVGGALGLATTIPAAPDFVAVSSKYALDVGTMGIAAAVLLLAAAAPFARPIVDHLRGR
jgi:hypothetical protein